MIFRIYHETLGGHVHIVVFAGRVEGALGRCGVMTMRDYEFWAFYKLTSHLFQFVESKVERHEGDEK